MISNLRSAEQHTDRQQRRVGFASSIFIADVKESLYFQPQTEVFSEVPTTAQPDEEFLCARFELDRRFDRKIRACFVDDA